MSAPRFIETQYRARAGAVAVVICVYEHEDGKPLYCVRIEREDPDGNPVLIFQRTARHQGPAHVAANEWRALLANLHSHELLATTQPERTGTSMNDSKRIIRLIEERDRARAAVRSLARIVTRIREREEEGAGVVGQATGGAPRGRLSAISLK